MLHPVAGCDAIRYGRRGSPLAHELKTSSAGQVRLVLAILSRDERARFRQAILRRRLQVLDRALTPADDRPCALALLGEGGRSEVFFNGPADGLADLAPVRRALQALMASARFHDGALLVLGRDRPRDLPKAQAFYPHLLVELREARDAGERRQLCDLGLAGLPRDEASAVSALLCWERARLNAGVRPEAAIYDFARAASDFRAAAAPARARAALRWARRLERDRQLDLFDGAQDIAAPSARYEVVPAMLAEGVLAAPFDASKDEAGIWSAVGEVRLDAEALDAADLQEAPVITQAMPVRVLAADAYELSFKVDLSPRAALGLGVNPGLQMLCALSADACEVTPSVQPVPAGATARFYLTGLIEDQTNLSLTVVAESGQTSQLRVVLIASPRGGHARIRLCGTGARRAA